MIPYPSFERDISKATSCSNEKDTCHNIISRWSEVTDNERQRVIILVPNL